MEVQRKLTILLFAQLGELFGLGRRKTGPLSLFMDFSRMLVFSDGGVGGEDPFRRGGLVILFRAGIIFRTWVDWAPLT